jgi:hypothetical protein
MFYGGKNLKFSELCGALYICLVIFLGPRICLEKLAKTTKILKLSNPAGIKIWSAQKKNEHKRCLPRVYIMAKYIVWKRAITL